MKEKHVTYIKRSSSLCSAALTRIDIGKGKTTSSQDEHVFVLKYARITTLSYITFVAIQKKKVEWVVCFKM